MIDEIEIRAPSERNPKLEALLAAVNGDDQLKAWWYMQQVTADRMGMSDHSWVHVQKVVNIALRLLRLLRRRNVEPVVVTTKNPNLELLPGMTASLSFQVDERTNVVKVPNAALRFYPATDQVRKEDLPILEGRQPTTSDADNNEGSSLQSLSITDRARLRKERSRHHVWIADGEGEKLRAVEVKTGLTDGQFTEMTSGAVKAGDALVIGIKPSDPLTFAVVVLLLTTIALFACWIPARRATRIDPLVALRYE